MNIDFAHLPVQLSSEVAAGFTFKRVSQDCEVAVFRQVHGAQGREVFDLASGHEGDYIWTRRPGLRVGVFVADCTAILMTGMTRQCPFVAAIHAGWRGTALSVIESAIKDIQPSFATVWLSPSLCVHHFEVGEDVRAAFGPRFFEYFFEGKENGKWQFDLKGLQRDQCAALLPSQTKILSSPLCTYCQPEFNSYRRSTHRAQPMDERHLAWVQLQDLSTTA